MLGVLVQGPYPFDNMHVHVTHLGYSAQIKRPDPIYQQGNETRRMVAFLLVFTDKRTNVVVYQGRERTGSQNVHTFLLRYCSHGS